MTYQSATYQSAHALRTALESRLLAQSTETGVSLDRLRRRVMFERIIASNATAPHRQPTSPRCRSRGRTATSGLQPAILLTSRPTQ